MEVRREQLTRSLSECPLGFNQSTMVVAGVPSIVSILCTHGQRVRVEQYLLAKPSFLVGLCEQNFTNFTLMLMALSDCLL